MFKLWNSWLKVCVLVLHNYRHLYSSSTINQRINILVGSLYKLSTQSLPKVFHYDFSKLTGVFSGLYSQSTEPITTTTLT